MKRVLLACASIVLCSTIGSAHAREPELRQVLTAYGLSNAEVIRLALPDPGAPQLSIDVSIAGQPHTLHLFRYSVRAPDYQLLAEVDGHLVDVPPGPITSFRGTVDNDPASRCTAAVLVDGLHCDLTFGSGERYFIEPLADSFNQSEPGWHLIHRPQDIKVNPKLACGVPSALDAGPIARGIPPIPGQPPYCVLELACDTDYPFFLEHGVGATLEEKIQAVAAKIEAVQATVNGHYQDQVGVTFLLTRIVVRPTSMDDPYPASTDSSDMSALLTAFVNKWNTDFSAVPRGAAILYSDRFTSGSVFGRSNTTDGSGKWCNSSVAYSSIWFDYVHTEIPHVTDEHKIDLVMHELGHLLEASHDPSGPNTMTPAPNEGDGEDPPTYTNMNTFLPQAVMEMHGYLTNGPGSTCVSCNPPENDGCAGATIVDQIVGFAEVPLTFLNATTDDPGGDIAGDIWVRIHPACNGDYRFTVCDAPLALRMAVYRTRCPVSDDRYAFFATSPCSAGTGLDAVLSLSGGNDYYLQIGHDPAVELPGQTVQARLVIECTAVNDECETAVDVTDAIDGGALAFCGSCATASSEATCFTGPELSAADVWYRFVAPETGRYLVDVTRPTPGAALPIAVYSGGCGSLTPLDCSLSSGTALFSATASDLIYIRVGGVADLAPNSGQDARTWLCIRSFPTAP